MCSTENERADLNQNRKMKKLIYGGLFLALVGIGIVACQKISENPGSSTNTEVSSNSSVEKVGPGFRIFTVQLHRPEGKINHSGVDCNCVFCAGFCEFKWFPDRFNAPTVGVDFISGTTARLYFFDDLDVDDVSTPIFYIDNDVLIPGDEDVTLESGEYSVNASEGVIEFDHESYAYNSYIDVPYSKE